MAYLYIDPSSGLKTSTALAEIWREIWWVVGERERERERERESKLFLDLEISFEGNKWG